MPLQLLKMNDIELTTISTIAEKLQIQPLHYTVTIWSKKFTLSAFRFLLKATFVGRILELFKSTCLYWFLFTFLNQFL
jgi:hypothetical protein